LPDGEDGKLTVITTNIGNANGTTSATITVGAGGAPINAQFIISTADNSTSGTGTVTDSKGNSYSEKHVQQNSNQTSLATVHRCRNPTAALVNGDTITFTPQSPTGTICAMKADYALGLANKVSVDNTGQTGTNSSPNINFTPANNNEFLVAVIAAPVTTTSFTQDVGNGWAAPPGQVQLAAPVLVGGSKFVGAAVSTTYNPTLGTSEVWTMAVTGFLIETVDMNSQSIMSMPCKRREPAIKRSRILGWQRACSGLLIPDRLAA
jgi:hypothetical protein